MSEVSYSVPWDLILGLGPHIVNRTATSVDAFTAGICERLEPAPRIEGIENLPKSATFVLVANHYQRKGMWILFPAAILTQVIRRHYGPGDPPVRWMVTANWPRVKVGPFSFASPGDILLPRVADALGCYPVSFAGANQAFTARSIRKILRDAPRSARPLGIFPEGVGGSAGSFSRPIPGVDRLLRHLGKAGMPAVPVCIAEAEGCLRFRIGEAMSAGELRVADDPAELAMQRVAGLR
jgi:1-acyl-sn-glycerol-3-phosphate acyltransferase